MINLLPPEEKENILSETKKRIAIILWFLFLFFIVCFILILVSINFYLEGQLESQKIIFEEAKKSTEHSEIQNLQEKFNLFNSALTKLNSLYKKQFYFYDILDKISKVLPGDAYLTNISAVSSAPDAENPSVQVALSGFIPDREKLFEIKKNLEKEEGISDVSFPPANWIKPSNIDFFVNFKIITKK